MKSKQLEVSEKLYLLAKKQFYELKTITREEYIEVLELILKRLNKAELEYDQLKILDGIFAQKNYQIDLKDTINYALSMN